MPTSIEALRELFASYSSETYKAQVRASESARQRFIERYPITGWRTLELEDYALGLDDHPDSLCRLLEFGSSELGSIRGGSAKKFQIYFNRDHGWDYSQNLYANEHDAWAALRKGFVQVLDRARAGQIEEADDVEVLAGARGARTKLLYIYFPDQLLPMYSKANIVKFLELLGYENLASFERTEIVRMNRALLGELRKMPGAAALTTYELMSVLYSWYNPVSAGIDAGFKFTSEQVDLLCARVTRTCPGFVSFAEPGEAFEKETVYKRNILARYRAELGNDGLRELVKAGRGQDALEKFSKIVGGNLVQFMSWRQSFGETDESAAEIFSAFLDAATGPFSTTERLRPIVEATKKHGLKQAWDTMSTTLWALRPEDYLPIKISYFRRLADELEQPLPKGRPGVNNFYKVLGFVRALETALEELQPSDLIDIQAFIWVACMPEENPEEESGAASAEISEQARELQSEETAFPLNQILYGPPGTGKTYNTMETAVEIIDGDPPATPREIKMRFDQLVDHGRIGFVTFHQSYSYEDFVEGIRPVMDGENGNGAPRYECRDGIFKQLCRTAADTGEGVDGAAFDLDGRAFWKMSLGATDSREGDLVYEESIEKGFIAHGFGEQIDFTGCADKAAIQLRISAAELEEDGPFTAEAVDRLMHGMHVGDVVIVTYGNRKFRALGEITGEYEFRADAIYAQTRPVRWLRVFEEPQSKERLMKSKNFSQMTIYGIDASNLRLDALRTMLEGRSRSDEGAHVLIIDEINRANISKVLGELITLLEPDKRADGANALRVTLPYSQETFAVPSNLFLIGTMNTADKSIALVDLALRRRFVFTELLPDFSVCRQLPDAMRRVLEELNRRIALRKDRDHRIGHAYFMTVSDATTFKRVFGDHIVPLLQEYFYNDWDGLRFVLGEVDKKGEIIVELPGGDSRWARNSWCWYYEVGNDSIDFLSVLERNYRLSLDQVDEPI